MITPTPSRPVAPALLRLFTLLFGLALAGCTSITLISAYDEGTDKGITEFQKSVETFLTGVERTGRPAGDLSKAEVAFFEKASVDLSSLRVRAAAISKNDITIAMLANLTESMSTLEELVKSGITKEQIKPIRDALNASTGAILKLELAKKRGEK